VLGDDVVPALVALGKGYAALDAQVRCGAVVDPLVRAHGAHRQEALAAPLAQVTHGHGDGRVPRLLVAGQVRFRRKGSWAFVTRKTLDAQVDRVDVSSEFRY